MSIYTGGTRITRARWTSAAALLVDFSSVYTNLSYQLYAGRTLAGTAPPGSVQVEGEVDPQGHGNSEGELVYWPPFLALLAVAPELAETDHGDKLPWRPYHRARLRWSTSGYPVDAQRFEITGGTEPGGAVDDANLLGTVLFAGDRTYAFDTPPRPGSGDWAFEITPRDNRGESGNAGPPLAVTVPLIAIPPDVVWSSSGQRLRDVSIAAQTLNLSVILP